jgi:DNA-binding CsgD family transcriptional regulator
VTLFHIDVTELLADRIGEVAPGVLSSFDHAIEISPDDMIVAILREAVSQVFGVPVHEPSHWTELSPRELEVARLIAQQYPNKKISETLECSIHTVKRHVTSIIKKLRVSERQEIAVWWLNRARLNQS